MDTFDNPKAALYAALALAQAEFQPILKNRSGASEQGDPFHYADLEELITKTRPALAAHGLAVIQIPQTNAEGEVELETLLVHSSGASIGGAVALGPHYRDMKTFGAALSFIRRYAYQAILSLAADDDLDSQPTTNPPLVSKAVAKRGGKKKTEETETPGLPPYPDHLFQKNLEQRRAAILLGNQTAEHFIALISSKYTMSEEQRASLRGIQAQAEADE